MVKIYKRDESLPGASKAGNAPASSTLASLAPGQSAVISGISAEGTLRMHLMELGFVSGSAITYVMSTPFGDPHIYSLRGTSIALRKSEARCIQVTL
jgi:Fe2+ transport system protein FeoA